MGVELNSNKEFQDITYEELKDLFWDKSMSDSMVAELYGVSKYQVAKKRKELGVVLRKVVKGEAFKSWWKSRTKSEQDDFLTATAKAVTHFANPGMYAAEKSDIGILPKKVPNKIGIPMAEALEGRPVTKGNSEETTANCTQRQGEALSGLDRIREAARRDKNFRFTNLMHHITVELLREAYKALKREVAPGIDGVTWQQYGK